MSDSYRENWQNPQAFATYEERRMLVGPAIHAQITEVLAENFGEGDTLVEIGAGDGVMRYYAAGEAQKYHWIETDQNLGFVQGSRTHCPERVQASSADLPFRTASLDGVIGFSMLDTLSDSDLNATAASTREALKTGGKVIHFLDMSPDLMAEVSNAKQHGEFPVPYHEQPNDPMGLVFIRIGARSILDKIQSIPEPQAIRNTLCNLINSPEVIARMANRTNVLPSLGAVLLKHGLVSRVVPNWLDSFGERLEMIFTDNGLRVVHNGIVTKRRLEDNQQLPPELRHFHSILRRQGVVTMKEFSKGIVLPGKVMIEADAHLFVAQKDDN